MNTIIQKLSLEALRCGSLNIMILIKHDNKGYIALISVLAAGAIGVAVSISLLLLGLGSSRTSFAYQQSNQAKALANACVEEALEQIRSSILYAGNGNLSFGAGACAYTVMNQGGQRRTIAASGAVDNTVRKIFVIINSVNPLIAVASWQEVAD